MFFYVIIFYCAMYLFIFGFLHVIELTIFSLIKSEPLKTTLVALLISIELGYLGIS